MKSELDAQDDFVSEQQEKIGPGFMLLFFFIFGQQHNVILYLCWLLHYCSLSLVPVVLDSAGNEEREGIMQH